MKIIDLTPQHLKDCPVWVFPTDDDLSINPVTKEAEMEDFPVIVLTTFIDNSGKKFVGYLYWGEPSTIQFIRPVMFLDKHGSDQVAFWNGMFEPTIEDIAKLKKCCKLPIEFYSSSKFGLHEIRGTLEGIYYLKNRQVERKI